jgi:SpoVK/Ycf46/Vps4 family AAA+-type ATPase
MSEFIKTGERIIVKPKGIDYDLINGKPYVLKYDSYQEKAYLVEDGELVLPDKIYTNERDEFFISRVHSDFITTDKNNIGVMLVGDKGTGKTLMSKMLSVKFDLPVIIIEQDFPLRKLSEVFTMFTTECCVIIDELEKRMFTNDILNFLDGVQATAKKLVIMTCNDDDELSEFLKDRSSRIKYLRRYIANDTFMYLDDILTDYDIVYKAEKESISEKIKKFKTPSLDNIITFIQEVKRFPGKNLDYLLQDMAIELKT